MGKAKDKPIADISERGQGPYAGSLDMTKDRGLINATAARYSSWRIPERLKEKAVKALEWAADAAKSQGDYNAVSGCVKTMAVLAAQEQTDELERVKRERLDAGLLTENCAGQIFVIPPPTLPNKR